MGRLMPVSMCTWLGKQKRRREIFINCSAIYLIVSLSFSPSIGNLYYRVLRFPAIPSRLGYLSLLFFYRQSDPCNCALLHRSYDDKLVSPWISKSARRSTKVPYGEYAVLEVVLLKAFTKLMHTHIHAYIHNHIYIYMLIFIETMKISLCTKLYVVDARAYI